MWYRLAKIVLAGLKEDLALILQDAGLAHLIRQIAPIPKFQKPLAYFLKQGVSAEQLSDYYHKLNKLEAKNKVKNIEYTKSGVKFNGKLYPDWILFTEHIDGLVSLIDKKKPQSGRTEEQNLSPMLDNGGIEVVKANNVEDAVKLGQGTRWCISQPGNTMFQSYRDTQGSTFYFVIDNTRVPQDPLRRVVVDMRSHDTALTDLNNTTGHIAEFDGAQDYFQYLQERGVDTAVFVNQPYTQEEKQEYENLVLAPRQMDRNARDAWFEKLPLDYKSKYIGRGGHLTDDMFIFLAKNNAKDLIGQYLNSGIALSEPQFNLIQNNNQLVNTYARNRKIFLSQFPDAASDIDMKMMPDWCIENARLAFTDKRTPYSTLPQALKDDLEFSMKAFYDGRARYEYLPQALKDNVKFSTKAYYDGAAKYHYLPKSMKNNVEFSLDAFYKDETSYVNLPEALQNDAAFSKKAFEMGRVQYYDLPPSLQDDMAFSRKAFDDGKAIYGFLPQALRNDLDFSVKAFRDSKAIYNDLPKQAQERITLENKQWSQSFQEIEK